MLGLGPGSTRFVPGDLTGEPGNDHGTCQNPGAGDTSSVRPTHRPTRTRTARRNRSQTITPSAVRVATADARGWPRRTLAGGGRWSAVRRSPGPCRPARPRARAVRVGSGVAACTAEFSTRAPLFKIDRVQPIIGVRPPVVTALAVDGHPRACSARAPPAVEHREIVPRHPPQATTGERPGRVIRWRCPLDQENVPDAEPATCPRYLLDQAR